MKLIDAFFCFFLFIHLFTSVLIDAIPFLPDNLAPAKPYFEAYLRDYKDPLMIKLPVWFQSILVGELLFQLPVNLYLFAKIASGKLADARIPAIIYSTHILTTLVPILGSLTLEHPELSTSERLALIGFIMPFAIAPAMMLFRFSCLKSSAKEKRT